MNLQDQAEIFYKKYYTVPNNDCTRESNLTAGDVMELMADFAKEKIKEIIRELEDIKGIIEYGGSNFGLGLTNTLIKKL